MAQKPQTYRVGSLHWKRGFQDLPTLLDYSSDGDILSFPSRISTVQTHMPLHQSLTLKGKKRSVILMNSPGSHSRSFQQPGFMIPSTQQVKFENLTITLEPETYGIDLPSSFDGRLILNHVTMNHERRVLYQDNRPGFPAIRSKGKGMLFINKSTVDYVDIDAPNMAVKVNQSQIGTFTQQSVIRAKTIEISQSHMDNTLLSSNKIKIADNSTHGGLGLKGRAQVLRTSFLPLNAPKPELYPLALTYLLILSGSQINMIDVLSEIPDTPPYYRHFDIRDSQVKIEGTGGLAPQALSSVSADSTVRSHGDQWLHDPTAAQLQSEIDQLYT